MTYIKTDITFTSKAIPNNINLRFTELQTTRLHLYPTKTTEIPNVYIPPRDSRNPDQANSDQDITNLITHILASDRTIMTGDFNAHDGLWHSPMTDHRGQLIADLLTNSDHVTLNQDTPTRRPRRDQQPTSPDISSATDSLYRHFT